MANANRAVVAAKERLSLALHQLSHLEDSDEEVEMACDNIREVLDQLCGMCLPEWHLVGKVNNDN